MTVRESTGSPREALDDRVRDEAGERRHRRRSQYLRLGAGIGVAAAVVVVALEAGSTGHSVAQAFRHVTLGRLPYLLLAIAFEALSFGCYALVQRRLLIAGGVRLTRRTMVSLAVAATGLTNLVPGGAAPAGGWLVNQYRRRGVPMPLALWAVLAGGFAAAVTVLLVLLVGAGVAGLLNPWLCVAAALVLGLGAAAVVMGVHRLTSVEAFLQRHHEHSLARRLQRTSGHLSSIVAFRASIAGGTQVLALSVANWALDVGCLAASFAFLGLPVPWRALIFAYATAQVAGSLAPVPGGIGFVEGGMVGAFALAGTPAGAALAATVVYRLITCWSVAAVGSVVLAHLSRRHPEPEASLGNEDGDRADGQGFCRGSRTGT